MADASPAVAKATYPQNAVRDLFETTATRFARIIEQGAEPDLTFALSALAVMSADEQVPLWDPYASGCPKGAPALIHALCNSVNQCSKQLRMPWSMRFNPQHLEDPKCEWLFNEPPTLTKQGEFSANLLERAETLLTILHNFVSGHARIARSVAAERDCVMIVLRLVAQCPSDDVRVHAAKVINRLAPFFEDEKISTHCFEIYAAILGRQGSEQTAQVAAVALEGLAVLAKRKQGGELLSKILVKYKTLAWMDAEGFFYDDAKVRVATLRALEALSSLREPPTEAAIKAAAEANAAAAAAAAAADGTSVPVDAQEGVSYIAAQVAKLSNLSGALVTAALQDENWGLRLCACRLVSILCSPPHEPESEEGLAGAGGVEDVKPTKGASAEVGDPGEESWAFVAKIAEHEELFADVSLSPFPPLIPPSPHPPSLSLSLSLSVCLSVCLSVSHALSLSLPLSLSLSLSLQHASTLRILPATRPLSRD